MDDRVKSLKRDLLSICWYMRGGITYDEAILLSMDDRKIINDIIDGNLETTKKTGMAFF